MGKRSRTKGTKGEQEVTRAYRDRGFNAARVPNSGGLDTKGDVLGIPGCHVEVKIGANIRLWDALRQAEEEAPPGQTPALHFRRSSRAASTGWYVTVPLDDFADLLEEAGRRE